MKIGIIRERKNPPDSRVPLSPCVCASLQAKGIDIFIEPSPSRCFSDDEYKNAGIKVSDNLEDCNVLMGVKEVPIEFLKAEKTYFFFSHTIKEQPHNRKLLQSILQKKIRLIDYEVLTDANGKRVIAFGGFAGMVGAHNALWTYGKRTKAFAIPRMKDLAGYEDAKKIYKNTHFPNVKIVLTGTGRVGQGAAQVLNDMGIKKVAPIDFLNNKFSQSIYTHLGTKDYMKKKDDSDFEKTDFYKNPEQFESIFEQFTAVSDIFINGIFYNKSAPAFFSKEVMKLTNFKIQVIADVTCDIVPESSVPSTLFATTIADPVFGYNPVSEKAEAPYTEKVIDIMSIDNLPNELARDASIQFGQTFEKLILDALIEGPENRMMKDATLTFEGSLTKKFEYLQNYVNQKNTIEAKNC